MSSIEIERAGAVDSVATGAPHILVIAVEQRTCTSIAAALAPLGRRIVVARSDREALDRLSAQNVGLIIFDVGEPAPDALETARTIRTRDRDTAIIFVTGARQDDDWVARAYELGLVELVVKPLASEVLRAKARTFMELRALRGAHADIAYRRAEFLANASAALSSSPAYEDVLHAVAGAAVPAIADWCAVDLVDGDRVRSVAVAHADPAKIEQARELRRRYSQRAGSTTCSVIRSGVPELFPEISEETLSAGARELGLRSAMVVPIKHRGASIGAITFVLAGNERRYTREDLVAATTLGECAGAAIANAKRYRETVDEMRFHETFSGIVGHDLRNPLAAIVATAQLLLERGAAPVDATLPRRILASAERMARMIDQLLDLTRIRAGGGIPSEPRSANLSNVIGEVVDELRASHPTREIVLDQRGSLTGTWDPDRLAQLVSNLVSNAMEHGVANTPVSIHADGSHPERVTLRVSNEGVIPDALVPVVFEPFRGTEYRRSRSAGLGLGLYIAREIVKVHGGTIELVTSEPRRTTLFVTLPRAKMSEPTHD